MLELLLKSAEFEEPPIGQRLFESATPTELSTFN